MYDKDFHEEANAGIEEIELRGSYDEQAYDFAVSIGLIEEGIDEDDIEEDVSVWRYDDDHQNKYFATEDEARARLTQSIESWEEIYGKNTPYEQQALATADEYFVMSKSLWEGDDWSPVYSTNYKEVAEEIAELLSDNGMSAHGQDLTRVVNTLIVTKQDLVDNFDYKISDAQETVANHYEAVEAERYPSESGAVNLYMPAGYKSKAERLAKFYGYKDNRHNVSISGLIRGLIDEKLNSSLIVNILSDEKSPIRHNHRGLEFEPDDEEIDIQPLGKTASDDELLGL